MPRNLIRPVSIGVATALVGAAAASTAFGGGAARHGVRASAVRTQGPGKGGVVFANGGPGLGGPFFVPGFGGPGPMPAFRVGLGARAFGSAALGADILNPAASYLGISLSTLESDLAGGKTLSQIADATTGKSSAGLISAVVASEQTVLDADKAAGWITADQETALVSAFTDAVTALVNNGPSGPPAVMFPGSDLLQTAATFLGVSVATLQSDLQSGKTLADIATAQGKTVSDLVTALEAPAKSKLDAAVSAGKITAAQETAILAAMTTRLTNLVNGTFPNPPALKSVRADLGLLAGLVGLTRHP